MVMRASVSSLLFFAIPAASPSRRGQRVRGTAKCQRHPVRKTGCRLSSMVGCPATLIPHALYFRLQRVVTLRPLRTKLRLAFSRLLFVVRRRGDRQYCTDRLDPKSVLVLIDIGDHHLRRRSSSAWAKKADAVRRISFARRSSRFSRSSSL